MQRRTHLNKVLAVLPSNKLPHRIAEAKFHFPLYSLKVHRGKCAMHAFQKPSSRSPFGRATPHIYSRPKHPLPTLSLSYLQFLSKTAIYIHTYFAWYRIKGRVSIVHTVEFLCCCSFWIPKKLSEDAYTYKVAARSQVCGKYAITSLNIAQFLLRELSCHFCAVLCNVPRTRRNFIAIRYWEYDTAHLSLLVPVYT